MQKSKTLLPSLVKYNRFIKIIIINLTLLIPLVILFYGFIGSSSIVFGHDTLGLHYEFFTFIKQSLTNEHSLPYWNPYIFCGYPFVGDPHSSLFYLPRIISILLFSPNTAINITIILHLYMAGLFCYYSARSFRLNTMPSLLSALIFMLSGFILPKVYGGHIIIIESYPYLPLYFMFVNLFFRARKMKYLIYFSFIAGLSLYTGSKQLVLYGLMASGLYFTLSALKYKHNYALKLIFSYIAACGLALLIALPQLIQSVIFVSQTLRASNSAIELTSSGNLILKDLATLIIPEFFGSPIDNSYWGSQTVNDFWDKSFYVGVFALVLTIIPVFIKSIRSRTKYLYLLLCIFVFLSFGTYNPIYQIFEFVFGSIDNIFIKSVVIVVLVSSFFAFLIYIYHIYTKAKLNYYILVILLFIILIFSIFNVNPLYYLVFKIVPGMNLFRIPARFMCISTFLFSILAGYGLMSLCYFQYSFYKVIKGVRYILYFCIFCFIILFIVLVRTKGFIINSLNDIISLYQLPSVSNYSYNSIINNLVVLFLSIIVIIILSYFIKNKKYFVLVLILFFILPTIELLHVNIKYIKSYNKIHSYVNNDITTTIDKDENIFRVMSYYPYFRNETINYRIFNANGYNPFILKKYFFYINKDVKSNILQPFFMSINEYINNDKLNKMNIKYIISNKENYKNNFKIIYNKHNLYMYINDNVFDRFRLTDDYNIISYNQYNHKLHSDNNKYLRNEIQYDIKNNFSNNSYIRLEYKIKVKKYSNNEIILSTTSNKNSILVSSEINYDGWKAYINGVETEIYSANSLFRAIKLPSGKHEITFSFSPPYLLASFIISWSIILLMIGFLLWKNKLPKVIYDQTITQPKTLKNSYFIKNYLKSKNFKN